MLLEREELVQIDWVIEKLHRCRGDGSITILLHGG